MQYRKELLALRRTENQNPKNMPLSALARIEVEGGVAELHFSVVNLFANPNCKYYALLIDANRKEFEFDLGSNPKTFCAPFLTLPNLDNGVSIGFYAVKDYIPLIDNWAICDTFCAGLKITKKYKKEMRNLILKYKDSDKEFELRFMTVMILNYYIDEEYLIENFQLLEKLKNNSYYVEMSIAWALCICLIKYYDETISYLKRCNLSNFIYNKTISKACDSYRISDEKKIELRKMRR